MTDSADSAGANSAGGHSPDSPGANSRSADSRSASSPSARRLEARRVIGVPASEVFTVLCDPDGHVAIDSSGMLQSADGHRVTGVDDRFVVHMDREALGDYDLGQYDVTVIITRFEQDSEIAWTIDGDVQPPIGHTYGYRLEPAGDSATEVVSYYDWSQAHPDWRDSGILPVLDAGALKATLGILERAVRRGYVHG